MWAGTPTLADQSCARRISPTKASASGTATISAVRRVMLGSVKRAALIVNPYSTHVTGDRITALLDWEMAHVGDPVEDIAWAYRAFWSPERFVPLPEFVATYEAAADVAVGADRLLWHRVFCEVKFATISLAAARSVVDGRSGNLRLIDRARTVAPALVQSLDWIVKGEPC